MKFQQAAVLSTAASDDLLASHSFISLFPAPPADDGTPSSRLSEDAAIIVDKLRSALEKMEAAVKERELQEKLPWLRAWRKASVLAYSAAFTAAVISSAVLSSVSVPALIPAAMAAVAAFMPPVWEWVGLSWEEAAAALEGELATMKEMKGRVHLSVHELENIRAVVERMEITGEEGCSASSSSSSIDTEELKKELECCTNNAKELMADILHALPPTQTLK